MLNYNQLSDYCKQYIESQYLDSNGDYVIKYKNGNKINIKKKNRGKFTDYCGGKVTDECIQKGKNSSNPTIRKRAIFAENARHFKHV